jgi:hypothetical protein
MILMLKAKLVTYIQKAGDDGVPRTKLLHRFKCKTVELDKSLMPLLETGEILEWTDKNGLGRPVTRYYHKNNTGGLTALSQVAIPVATEIPTRSTPCQVCGAAIPSPEHGRPFSYCSPACRRASREGGRTLTEFFLPAADPCVFAEAAVPYVITDLIMRGFRVAREFYRTASTLLVLDGQGGICTLTVVAVGRTGTFPDPLEFESMAAVYRDGRIVYGGRIPLVPSAPEETLEEEIPSEVKSDEPTKGENDGN